jgi:acyl-coenzyme A synthetase/AMP-(fatty) acid ligase
VVDDALRPVPGGVTGELCIGGIGVGAGYVNDEALTRVKFVPDHLGGEGGRLYRTGDLARVLDDGALEFVGRADHQVKVRGFRVDLGDVEAVLQKHPSVRQAVVLLDPRTEALAAFVVLADGTDPAPAGNRRDAPFAVELRRFLRGTLPSHMVPGVVARLDALPLNPNGKVDRHALRRRLVGADGPPGAAAHA